MHFIGGFMKIQSTVCDRFHEERKRLDFGLVEIAERCEVSSTTVGRWCKNIAIPSDKLGALYPYGFDAYYIVTGYREDDIFETKTGQSKDGTYIKEDVELYVGNKSVPLICIQKGTDEAKWLNYIQKMSVEDRAIIEPTIIGFAERGLQKESEVG